MLARAARLNASRDFARIYRKGQSARSRLFRIAWQPSSKLRIAIVTGRKVSTKAVIRNHIKRQVGGIVYDLLPKFQSVDLIIQLQPNAQTTYQELELGLRELLTKSRLLRSDPLQ